MINYDLLTSEAKKLGIDLGEYGADRFDTYAERLVRWNEHINLTAITEPDDIVIKHFIDSLYIMKYVKFKEGEQIADVGTGAGFPGLPLLFANPDTVDVTFVDSSGKRIGFIKDVLNNTGLIARRVHERAEILGKDPEFRERFDYATARAVAPLNVLCEYCLPLVKVGGLFVSLKGSSGMQELESATNAIEILGGEVARAEEYSLPNGDGRSIIIIRKVSQTPTKYPRKSKKIDTKPL
ncbi:MAG: 16S rRNA (guanine(527)-N(7))-methyltransferase RsmG [Eubacterium sp.]